MAKITVSNMGLKGVNVDKNPLELDDAELTQAQNATVDVSAGMSSITKRPGLIRFTTAATAGVVLGGIDLPVEDISNAGLHYIYVGRGAVIP